jgi:DNA-binding response OmpR family regulator
MTVAPITPPAVEYGFWIWSQAQARTSRCLAPEPARSSVRLRRILLIDDTPEIAELLTFALRDRAFTVFAAGFTDTVNELILEQKVDALVLDCSSFDMSESLFDTVRAHPNHAKFPVVIISDTPEEADASLRSRDARKVLLIPKPFTGAQVARALDELLK